MPSAPAPVAMPLVLAVPHIILYPDLSPLSANTPALRPNLVALSAEHLNFAVLDAQRILHLAERPLQRLVPLHELDELDLDMRPRSVAWHQHVVEWGESEV